MRKRRLILVLLLCLLLTAAVSAAGQKSAPYAICVNRAMNTVTIYEQDAGGNYTIPVKAMVCSTARAGYVTPLGQFTLQEFRSEWRLMVDGTYGQYATCFKGNYLFHSICYSDDSHDAMVRESYNKLGEPASMGCVRLETIDAKWIFDNCPAGTPVTIYDDPENPGPLGKPEPTLDYISEEGYNGWDPTDPAKGNPWREQNVTAVTVKPGSVTLSAGEKTTLTASTQPEGAAVVWKSSDETVAVVDENGVVTGLSAGTVQIEAVTYNGRKDGCTVRVQGELLPFDDLIPGAWYYGEARKALEKGLFSGVGERTFNPDGSMTRAMVVQVLYNLEKKPAGTGELTFADVARDSWYHDAVRWAVAEGIVQGVSEREFRPNQPMTRQEMAVVLWRYRGMPKAGGDLTAFSDGKRIPSFAQDAMSWAVEQGLMAGSGGSLRPASRVTRMETAAILCRMLWK